MVVERHEGQQPPLGYQIKELIGDINRLFSQHAALFRHEIKQDATTAAKYTAVAIAGVLVAYTSLIFLGFFMIFTLSLFMPLWLSSLVVTLIYFVIAAIALIIAKNHITKIKSESENGIDETKKTLEEAKKWIQDLK